MRIGIKVLLALSVAFWAKKGVGISILDNFEVSFLSSKYSEYSEPTARYMVIHPTASLAAETGTDDSLRVSMQVHVLDYAVFPLDRPSSIGRPPSASTVDTVHCTGEPEGACATDNTRRGKKAEKKQSGGQEKNRPPSHSILCRQSINTPRRRHPRRRERPGGAMMEVHNVL
jgi:hypothetical protein